MSPNLEAPHPESSQSSDGSYDHENLARPLFGIDERPGTWWECLLYGWQHTLVDISPFVLPLAVAGALGMGPDGSARFINYCLFAMGVATLFQTTLGNRLPIVQGPSATLTGTLAPLAGQLGGPAMWGGIFIGGLVEALVGASRVLGSLRRLLPAAVSGAVVTVIGLSLGGLAVRLSIGDGSARNLAYAGGVVGLIFVLQTLGSRVWGGLLGRGAIFIAIWTVGLGIAGVLGHVDWSLVASKPWIALPALFPFGGPGFGWEWSLAAILVILAGYFGSMVESLGDYAATCAVAGEEYTEKHMNRGIFAEGVGSMMAAALGALPCTSYTQNIGIIASTRVASRFVVQIAAGVLLLYGLCPKFGALLVAMPRPVLGGVFVIVCGMIVLSGMRLIQSAPPSLSTDLVVGTTLILSLGVPVHVNGLGETWLDGLAAFPRLMLTNSVVLAVLLGVGLNLVMTLLVRDAENAENAENQE